MNIGFITGIFYIIASWIFLFFSLSGWGNVLIRFFNLSFLDDDEIFARTWLGFAFAILFFSTVNLFLSINYISSCLFFVFGIMLCYSFRESVFKTKFKSIFSYNSMLIIGFALLVALFAIQLPYCYDTGFYHLNSIRWLNEHSIVPGLGNLHHRLGFNQLFFTWAAALNFHPWFNDYAFHIANSFLVILFIAQLILNNKIFSSLIAFLMVFLPVPVFWIASPSPDIASAILQLCVFNYFVSLMLNAEKRKYASSYISLIAVIAAIATAIKLSNAVFALGLAFVSWVYLRQKVLEDDKVAKCAYKRVVCFLLLLIAVWVSRGYILTGYPLFPSTFGKINFDWALSNELANYAERCIKVFARLNYYDFQSPYLDKCRWVVPWLENNLSFFSGISSIVLLFVGNLCVFWGVEKLKENYRENMVLFLLWAIVFLSIVFWFVQAPDIRFAGGLFIMLFIIGLLFIKNLNELPLWLGKCFIGGAFAGFLAFYLYYGYEGSFSFIEFLNLPKVPVLEETTDYGLKLKVPKFGDQLWDSELLATPEFKKGLKLRGKDIASGFAIVGGTEYIKNLEEKISTNFVKIMESK